jgi:hypothetical protein
MPPRCAGCPRRWHRNREASETRFAQTADASLSDFGASDVAPSTGIHVKGSVKSNCKSNYKSNGNGNCRCAGVGLLVQAGMKMLEIIIPFSTIVHCVSACLLMRRE